MGATRGNPSVPTILVPSYSTRVLTLLAIIGGAACTPASRRSSTPSPTGGMWAVPALQARDAGPCGGCAPDGPLPDAISRAIETRLVELERRGGMCARYGQVLERSYRDGRITIRPYMWRVGSHLASGEAKPNGEMTLALDVDSLNVGVRTVDDVLWTMEHEAVHIALAIASGLETHEDVTNDYVRACRSDAAVSHAAAGRGPAAGAMESRDH